MLRDLANRVIERLPLFFAEELIAFFIKYPHHFFGLAFYKAFMNRSLAEAANLCLEIIIKKDTNLKAAVLLSTFEHKYLINPNWEPI